MTKPLRIYFAELICTLTRNLRRAIVLITVVPLMSAVALEKFGEYIWNRSQ
jgi:hypothetical protein